jgi:hypothetical protein
VSPHLQRLRLTQALANGGGLDHYVIGRLDGLADRSGSEAVREIFRFHAAHEELYRGLTSCASVALLTGPRPDVEEHRGWFRVLAEEHVPFDVLTLDAADERALARYEVILVPGLEPIGEEIARRIDAWVEAGGTLVVSGLAGFRDDEYEPRRTPAFACLGIESVREVRSGMRGAYFAIDHHDGFDHLRDTELLYLDGPYVNAEYVAGTERHLRLIPPGPFGPPERVVLAEPTGEPGMTVRDVGDGRAIWLPWRCGALVERDGHPNTAGFLADVLERHARVTPIGGTLSPMVEVTLFERPNGDLLLHLVNASGHFGVRELAPVPMHDVEVVVPFEGEPGEVHAVVGGTCTWAIADGVLTVTISELGVFEALVVPRKA